MDGDLQRQLGRNLRAIQVARGYSQEAFAELLGFHRTYLGALERGERNISLGGLERLAALLALDPLTLLARR